MRWNKENIKEYMNNFGYEVISIKLNKNQKTIGIKSIAIVRCPYCKEVSEIIIDKFINRNKRCKCEKHWTEYKIKQLFNNSNYELIDIIDLKDSLSRLLIQCPNKNHKPYEIFIYNFIRNHKCQECIREDKIIWKEKDIVDFVNNNGYNIVNIIEGGGLKTRLSLQCDKLHEPYEVTFDNFLFGCRCPMCKYSKGEARINDVIDKYNIDNIKHYPFDDCRNINPLPFDFYLPKYNILIEYDGIQHYKIGCFNNTLLDLMNLKRRDNIKTQYCIDNNIKLIRIPYWNFNNIEKILIKELNLNNLDTKLK